MAAAWRTSRSSREIRRSCSPIRTCPSACPTASTRSDRIVSANSECGPLNEWMNPAPSARSVQRLACTAAEQARASRYSPRVPSSAAIHADEGTRGLYRLALACSAAVQADRWTDLADGAGYIHSFNGPHSLFSDTVRSLRVLAVGHALGHVLMGENDRRISLFDRLVQHAAATAKYNVYYGEGRDGYDFPVGSCTRASSTSRTAGTAARVPSRATARSAPGPGDWPGSCAGTPRSWSSSKPSTTRSSSRTAGGPR